MEESEFKINKEYMVGYCKGRLTGFKNGITSGLFIGFLTWLGYFIFKLIF